MGRNGNGTEKKETQRGAAPVTIEQNCTRENKREKGPLPEGRRVHTFPRGLELSARRMKEPKVLA